MSTNLDIDPLGGPGGDAARRPADVDAEVLRSAPSYVEAQRVVDHLSDAGFPVEHTGIVGHDLRMVEDVTGRLTRGRAALAGAGTGAWLGLLVGLIVGIFSDGDAWIGLVIGGLALGALWGAVLGFAAHWSTRGNRDFSSRSAIVADRYDVVVAAELAGEARTRLGQPAG